MKNHDPESVERRLEDLLADAETTVSALRREFDELQRRRLSRAEIAAQHDEIDRLREHLEEAQVHWGKVRGFFEEAARQLEGDDPR